MTDLDKAVNIMIWACSLAVASTFNLVVKVFVQTIVRRIDLELWEFCSLLIFLNVVIVLVSRWILKKVI